MKAVIWVLFLALPDVGSGYHSVTLYSSRKVCEQQLARAKEDFAQASVTVAGGCEPQLVY